MPPKISSVASPSPPPAPVTDTHDILIIADMADALDQIPNELTRVHSDLNELAAVLYCELMRSQAPKGKKLMNQPRWSHLKTSSIRWSNGSRILASDKNNDSSYCKRLPKRQLGTS